jgi:tRNA (cmo5U34)-methyltransferase
MRDKIFQKSINETFRFNKEVSQVFDDMVERSVPCYHEVQNQMATLAKQFYQPCTKIYDIGCSTGTTLDKVRCDQIRDCFLVGVDESQFMIDRARSKLGNSIELINDSFLHVDFEQSSAVILSLTYQFVRPVFRAALVEKIHNALEPGGIVLLFEKILPENDKLHDVFESRYYAIKEANGYSQQEILNKRKALEHTLIPSKASELRYAFKAFHSFESFYQCYNFQAFLAIK